MKTKFAISLFLSFLISVTSFAQKIFMTGDPHVSGKAYPMEIKKILDEEWPTAEFSYWGKAGAGFYTFNDTPAFMDSIYNAAPDILLVHLGTNGCYAVAFNPEKTWNDIETFYGNVSSHLPDTKVIFVTPFYNKNHKLISKNGKKKTYGPWQVNENTRACSDLIIEFSKQHPGTYVIDNNAEAGTVFLDEPGLIREDYVHLTIEGYQVLGQQVVDGLLDLLEAWAEDQPEETWQEG